MENETVETPAPAVTVQQILDLCNDKISEIEKLDKKSNYHNARRSTFKAIRDLIQPPPPKPKKEPKAKKAAAGAGEVTQPAGATDEDTTRVVPVEDAA